GCAGQQISQLRAEDLQIALLICLDDSRLRLPAGTQKRSKGNARVRSLAKRADPLHGHGRCRVALPGKEQCRWLKRSVVRALDGGLDGLVGLKNLAGSKAGEGGSEKRSTRQGRHERRSTAALAGCVPLCGGKPS